MPDQVRCPPAYTAGRLPAHHYLLDIERPTAISTKWVVAEWPERAPEPPRKNPQWLSAARLFISRQFLCSKKDNYEASTVKRIRSGCARKRYDDIVKWRQITI